MENDNSWDNTLNLISRGLKGIFVVRRESTKNFFDNLAKEKDLTPAKDKWIHFSGGEIKIITLSMLEELELKEIDFYRITYYTMFFIHPTLERKLHSLLKDKTNNY